MKKIVISIILIMALGSSMIYASTSSEDRYIIINNESTNIEKLQNTGTINENDYAGEEDGDLDGMHPIDTVIPFDESNASLITPDKISLNKFKSMSMVEDTKEFNVTNFRNGNEYKITANLEYSGYKVNVWVCNNSITRDEAISIGKEFENNIYNTIRNNFGYESDVDNDSKINILCYDIIDNFAETNVYTQGYFSPKDLYDVENSNHCEMFYIDTYPAMGTSNKKDLSKIYPVLAHEFQHMVNYNENVLKRNKQDMETWLDEGLSLAAEQVYLKKPRENRINYYNKSKSIANGHSLLYWDYNGDTVSNYALSYLFIEYLRIQVGQGDSIYKEILNSPQSNYKSVELIIQKYIDPNITFGEFMTNFRVALVLNEASGKYGFKNEDGFNNIVPRIYAGKGTDLRGGGCVVLHPSIDKDIKIPENKGQDIAYVDTSNIGNIPVKKIIGTNRYDTAAKISQEAFRNKTNSVVLVNGSSYSDGLSSGPLSSVTNSSTLLTRKDKLPNETKNELKRLQPSKIYIIGGSSAIQESVVNEISNITNISKENIVRIAGDNREETSLKIAKYIQNISDVKSLYLVNGYKGEADAMSILSKACKDKQPIVITNGKELNEESTKWITNLGTKDIYIIGGEQVMTRNIISSLENIAGNSLESNRIYGENRQETNAKVVEKFHKNIDTIIITKSDELIDALSVGTLAGMKNAPIVMGTNKLTTSQIKVIKQSGYKNIIEVGGNINPNVISSIR